MWIYLSGPEEEPLLDRPARWDYKAATQLGVWKLVRGEGQDDPPDLKIYGPEASHLELCIKCHTQTQEVMKDEI